MGERRLYLPTSNSFFSVIHVLSHVHFTRWTPGGTQGTFIRRTALSTSMLSSTTTWVMPGLSAFSVCPPFCLICRWKIWCLAFPIPAGRTYAVTPANVFPGKKNPQTNKKLQWTNKCCKIFVCPCVWLCVCVQYLTSNQQFKVLFSFALLVTTCNITFFRLLLCWRWILPL